VLISPGRQLLATRSIPLSALIVYRANDRHGELENENAAIGCLFDGHEVDRLAPQHGRLPDSKPHAAIDEGKCGENSVRQ
jgi:hypothetical protein